MRFENRIFQFGSLVFQNRDFKKQISFFKNSISHCTTAKLKSLDLFLFYRNRLKTKRNKPFFEAVLRNSLQNKAIKLLNFVIAKREINFLFLKKSNLSFCK
jgi:hypothetical protein